MEKVEEIFCLDIVFLFSCFVFEFWGKEFLSFDIFEKKSVTSYERITAKALLVTRCDGNNFLLFLLSDFNFSLEVRIFLSGVPVKSLCSTD